MLLTNKMDIMVLMMMVMMAMELIIAFVTTCM